jgi:AraC-like DNA-binding protein
MSATSLASAARPFWRLLGLHGIDPEPVFRAAGLDPALMDVPRARYRVDQRTAAWKKAAEVIGDPCFGLRMQEVLTPADLHALGYALYASSTLRTALGRLSRYVHVINDGIGFALAEAHVPVAFTLNVTETVYPTLLVPQEDSLWSWIIGVCRSAAGEQLAPLEVRFKHPDMGCSRPYERFFRCPIRYDCIASTLLFDRAEIERPLPAANRELARYNDRLLTNFLNKLHRDDLVGRVKTAIVDELPSGTPSDESIADAVHMSARTLQRRLAAEGTSYSKLLDTVRQELAEQYISDPALSLSEIGFLLGFSEPSGFSRAFRRWTGITPTAAREPGTNPRSSDAP